jgi:hypothetical protein
MNNYLMKIKYGSKGSTSLTEGNDAPNSGRHHFSYNGSQLQCWEEGFIIKEEREALSLEGNAVSTNNSKIIF